MSVGLTGLSRFHANAYRQLTIWRQRLRAVVRSARVSYDYSYVRLRRRCLLPVDGMSGAGTGHFLTRSRQRRSVAVPLSTFIWEAWMLLTVVLGFSLLRAPPPSRRCRRARRRSPSLPAPRPRRRFRRSVLAAFGSARSRRSLVFFARRLAALHLRRVRLLRRASAAAVRSVVFRDPSYPQPCRARARAGHVPVPTRPTLGSEAIPAPAASRLSPAALRPFSAWQVAARRLNTEVQRVEIRVPAEIDTVVDGVTRQRVEALGVVTSTMFVANRKQIVTAIARTRLPAIYGAVTTPMRAGSSPTARTGRTAFTARLASSPESSKVQSRRICPSSSPQGSSWR